MKKVGLSLVASSLLVVAPLLAAAAPHTFYFTTPGWSNNVDPSVFGSALDIAVTVDNGSSSSSDQSYEFSQILSVGVAAVNGSFLENMSSVVLTQDNAPVITTSQSGVATLFLGNINDMEGAWGGNDLAGTWAFQLGQLTAQGGFTPIALWSTADTNYSAWYAPYDGSSFLPIVIQSSVAELSTTNLILVGLAGICLWLKRKTAQVDRKFNRSIGNLSLR